MMCAIGIVLAATLNIAPSAQCPRYFATPDGKPWIPIGINLCYAHPDGNTAIDCPERESLAKLEKWMRAFAANGGNYMRFFLCRPTFEVFTDEVGVYNRHNGENVMKIVRLAEELGVKIKMTVECFRTVKPASEVKGEHNIKCNKPIYAPFAGGTMHGFYTSEKCREIFLGKLAFLKSLGVGDSPAVIDWEPFDEINCCGAPEDSMPWSKVMLAKIHEMFPKQMVTQNIGSFSEPYIYSYYDMLAKTEPNHFLQVHRYVDPGAAIRICRGPMDVLCADAVRELLDRRRDKPVVVAETGAVEAFHADYSRLYDVDKKGMLLHDCIFAPFFAGAAGTGCNWHWGQMYIDRWNLWHHYKWFRTAIEGIDPIAEDFKPLKTESRLHKVYALVGKRTTLVWLRDQENTWENELVKGIEPQEIKSIPLPFRSPVDVKWYLPWENRHVTTSAGQVQSPVFCRSAVGRFPTTPWMQLSKDDRIDY